MLLLLLVSYKASFSQNNLEDVKKEANRLFEEEEFTSAYKLFAQLVANYPKDPVYNFKLGVCMIYSEPDKKKCLPFLQFANSKADEAPKETKFYLGKAYHINYRFDEAIKFYNEYKKIGSSKNQKRLQVDQEIRACGNGKRLLSNLSDLVVQSKKTLNETDYFRSYELKDIGGKLLVKPEDFKTSPDKKKKDKSVVYVPKTGDRVYYSSYGPNTETGRDIYYKVKLPNGEFGPPQKVKGINTEFDEDYPFLHPNGTTLYFASKGFNGMGGYDIFKSVYNPESDSWSLPVNLEFPINSPDDDYLFVTDSLEKTAYFSTGRQSLPGKIDVLKISTERKPIDVLAIKGTVVKENADQSLKSVITVKNMDNGEEVGSFSAQDNGDYLMDLPNGAKLLFTVATPGLETQSDKVALPMVATSKALKQTISYDNGVLKIINYFDEATSDESYIQYLKIIEQKAKLDVNLGKNKLNPQLLATSDENKEPLYQKGTGNTDSNNGGPTIVEDTTSASGTIANSSNPSKSGLSNNELAKMAKQDAEESEKEAIQLKQDAADAYELGNQKKIEADKKLKEGEDAYSAATAIFNEEEKKSATEKAIAIKTQAENELQNAENILSYAKALENDATNKQKIAQLNNEYVKELDKVIAGKSDSKASLQKMEELEKEIAALSSKKNESEEAYTAIKNNADEKEKELLKIEETNKTVSENLQEIKTAIAGYESDLSGAKKKKDKESIQEKINELKAEQIEKEKQISANESDIQKLKNDFESAKNGLDLANKIKNETIAAPVNTTSIAQNGNTSGNNAGSNNPNEISSKSLQEKYKDKILVSDNTDKTLLETANNQLKNYNKDIESAISKNKKELAAAKTQSSKQAISDEIKALETAKNKNTQQIAANNNFIDDIDKTVAANNKAIENSPNLNPVKANNSNEAVQYLENLNNKLSSNDNNNFEYNGYQNTEAQNLKIEADAKINEAAVQQKKLKELITATNDQLKNPVPENNTSSEPVSNSLFKEMENLFVKAQEYRKEASTKSGSEKDELLAKAKETESKADEKHLEASEALKTENQSTFDINNENYQMLKNLNKAPELDMNEANRLIEEASIAFKQAATIRKEANSMTSIGAKLGNLSNAEEKEAEAIQKQEQALYVLKKTSPNVALKSVSGNSANVSKTDTAKIGKELESVNSGINELANTKLAAYQKLYEANKLELEQIKGDLKNKQNIIDNNSSFSSEWSTASGQIKKGEGLKQASETAGDNNGKLNDLIAATKLQIDALNRLNQLNKNLDQPIASNNSSENSAGNNGNQNSGNNTNSEQGNEIAGNKTTNNKNENNTSTSGNNNQGNEVAGNKTANNANENNANSSENNNQGNEVAGNKTVNSGNENNANSGENTNQENKTAGNNTENNGNEIAANNTSGNNTDNTNENNSANGNQDNKNPANNNQNNPDNIANGAIDTKTVNVEDLAKKDTSAAQLANYFSAGNSALKNPGANQMVKNSISELKKIEEENKSIEEQIKNSSSGNNSGETPTQLKTKSENLLIEAEDLSVKAFDMKTLANTKNGSEKDSLLEVSNKLDEQSQDKKLEAVKLTEIANQTDYDSNSKAIKELMEKANQDNPDLTSQLSEKNNEIATLKNQAEQLRKEANTLSNNNAKIGSLMNAEEKEAELLQKQNEVLAELKKQYPDYVVKEAVVAGNGSIVPEELKLKQSQLKEKQFSELTNLTNAFSLEYETSKSNVPENLNEEEKKVKQNAEDLNAESKRLLIKSVSVSDEKEKEKILALAAKTGNAAVEQQNKLIGATNTVAKNNNAGNNNKNNAGNNENNNTLATNNGNNNSAVNNNAANNAGNNNNPNNTGRNNNAGNNTTANNNPDNNAGNNTPAGNRTGRGTVKIDGLEVVAGNAYNNNKPIPIDAPVPNGLVFRVQIGAFKSPLPNNTFRGLSPVNGENASNGYIRYTAGNFNKIENANAVKNDLRGLGYSDAFVVVYYNGKRITIAEAMEMLNKEGKVVDNNAIATAGINANANIPKQNNNPRNPNLNAQDAVTVTKELEQTNGLLFTVQIGVYNRQISRQRLMNLKPIYTEKLPSGLYRYTAGVYSNTEKLITDKNKVVNLGVRDAFVSAYLNGKKVTFAEGKIKQQDSTTKMEPENPIIFPEANTANVPVNNNTPANNTANNTVQPFTNNVSAYPEATPENGIKASQEGICFKVQIGAYSKQVPNEVAAKFSAIKNWPIENKQVNNLFIYNVGNFSSARFAKTLKDEAVSAGINDAFITVYKDGQRLSASESAALLNQ